MITDEIVERVAREASIADGQNPDKLSHNSFAWWRHYVPVARAALSAALSVEPQKVPTSSQVNAFHEAYDASLEHHPRETAQAIYDGLCAALSVEQPTPQTHVNGLLDAAREVIACASDIYKKRNGHLASFEDDSGEKCWIVPFDAFEGLRAAVEALATEGK